MLVQDSVRPSLKGPARAADQYVIVISNGEKSPRGDGGQGSSWTVSTASAIAPTAARPGAHGRTY